MASFSVHRGAWTAAVDFTVEQDRVLWHTAMMTMDGVQFGWGGEMTVTVFPDHVIHSALLAMISELMDRLPD